MNAAKAYLAEFVGTLTLVAMVIGSGIMGSNLSTDIGVVLLINTISTILGLALLIFVLGPISGAHFNPVVSLVMFLQKQISLKRFLGFSLSQSLGAITGALLANAMFDLSVIQISTKVRSSPGLFLGEVIATVGLLVIILACIKQEKTNLIPVAVAAWIGSAYLFTSSTSFANPAVTIGRIFSDSFAGIAPESVLAFIAAQFIGAGIVVLGIRLSTNQKI